MCDYISRRFGSNHLINYTDIGQRRFIGYSVDSNKVFGKPARNNTLLQISAKKSIYFIFNVSFK